MVSTKAKRRIVIALVAGVGFVIGLMMVPPPNQAEAAWTKRGHQCLLENLQHVGSDTAAGFIQQACFSCTPVSRCASPPQATTRLSYLRAPRVAACSSRGGSVFNQVGQCSTATPNDLSL